MAQCLLKRLEDNLWALSGIVDMRSAAEVLADSKDFLQENGETVVDLTNVERIDSAGLALLIEWMREARRQKTSVRFRNIPSQMAAIAKVCGLEQFLPREAFQADT